MQPRPQKDLDLTDVRRRVGELLTAEADDRGRHVVVLAVDGIPHQLATEAWPRARTERLSSVFPPTSSAAWLSSLTGLSVADHGVPGVVFDAAGDGRLIDVFDYSGELCPTPLPNAFSDARDVGYAAVAIPGDMKALDCSWREVLLAHADICDTPAFFAVEGTPAPPQVLVDRVRSAVAAAIAAHGADRPCFVWCFVDVDHRVHRVGYDDHVTQFVAALDDIATNLAEQGCIVVAYADHGLVPTRTDPQVASYFADVTDSFGLRVGGAGRTRWIYGEPYDGTTQPAVLRDLPDGIRVLPADALFSPGSAARKRVGDILLIAEADDFITSEGYCFDHGSCLQAEMDVPFSVWSSTP